MYRRIASVSQIPHQHPASLTAMPFLLHLARCDVSHPFDAASNRYAQTDRAEHSRSKIRCQTRRPWPIPPGVLPATLLHLRPHLLPRPTLRPLMTKLRSVYHYCSFRYRHTHHIPFRIYSRPMRYPLTCTLTRPRHPPAPILLSPNHLITLFRCSSVSTRPSRGGHISNFLYVYLVWVRPLPPLLLVLPLSLSRCCTILLCAREKSTQSRPRALRFGYLAAVFAVDEVSLSGVVHPASNLSDERSYEAPG